MEWYLKAAELGDAKAQYIVAARYQSGNIVEQNYEEAVKWFKASAENGNIDSYYTLFLHYIELQRNVDEALEWLDKGCDAGNTDCIYTLGQYYFTTEDYDKAVELYKKGAEKGDANSCVELAQCYYHGISVEQNKEKAFELLEYAVNENNYKGGYFLAKYLIAENRNPEDIERAIQILEILANNGIAPAQYSLGELYLKKNDFVTQDLELGIKWIKIAAENDDVDAQMTLAECYENGIGVTKSMYNAVTWYKKAAEQGSEEAEEKLMELEEYSSTPY
jgi:TPR repeat protein